MYKLLKAKLENSTNATQIAAAEIISLFKPISAKRNEVLLSLEETCKYYFFIEKGSLRLFTTNTEGKESSRYFAFEGSFCTALPSFIDQKPAMEFLQAIETCKLLAINRTDFFKMVEKHSFFAGIYQEILESGFIMAQKRIYSFQGFDALEKVKWLIQYQPNVLLRVSNKMAASYLGISPSTLSRIKAKL